MQIDPNCAGLQPLWGENHPFLNFPWDLILQRIDRAPTVVPAVAFMTAFGPFWVIRPAFTIGLGFADCSENASSTRGRPTQDGCEETLMPAQRFECEGSACL